MNYFNLILKSVNPFAAMLTSKIAGHCQYYWYIYYTINKIIKTKKIAKLSFKEPYLMLSRINYKNDFSSVRRSWDNIGTFLSRI